MADRPEAGFTNEYADDLRVFWDRMKGRLGVHPNPTARRQKRVIPEASGHTSLGSLDLLFLPATLRRCGCTKDSSRRHVKEGRGGFGLRDRVINARATESS